MHNHALRFRFDPASRYTFANLLRPDDPPLGEGETRETLSALRARIRDLKLVG